MGEGWGGIKVESFNGTKTVILKTAECWLLCLYLALSCPGVNMHESQCIQVYRIEEKSLEEFHLVIEQVDFVFFHTMHHKMYFLFFLNSVNDS